MSIGIGNEHEVFPFQVVLGANEVLRVMADGQFVWNPDADRMIEEGDFSFSPALPHILRALRKSAQPAQEPVAWRVKTETMLRDGSIKVVYQTRNEKLSSYDEPLYTTPPQRPWVGLTDEQYFAIGQRHWLPSTKIAQIHKEINEAAHGITAPSQEGAASRELNQTPSPTASRFMTHQCLLTEAYKTRSP